jgi:hypothetical protein
MPRTPNVARGEDNTLAQIVELEIVIRSMYCIFETTVQFCTELWLIKSHVSQTALICCSPHVDHVSLKQPTSA